MNYKKILQYIGCSDETIQRVLGDQKDEFLILKVKIPETYPTLILCKSGFLKQETVFANTENLSKIYNFNSVEDAKNYAEKILAPKISLENFIIVKTEDWFNFYYDSIKSSEVLVYCLWHKGIAYQFNDNNPNHIPGPHKFNINNYYDLKMGQI